MPGEKWDMSTALIAILRETQQLLNREGNDLSWSSWNDAQEADAEIERQLQRIEQADYSDLFNLQVLYAPTGPIQEVSLSSGWGNEFLVVAARFDNEIQRLGRLREGDSSDHCGK